MVIWMVWDIAAISSLIINFRAQKVTVMLATVELGKESNRNLLRPEPLIGR